MSTELLLKEWASSLSHNHYFNHHFIVQKKELAAEFLEAVSSSPRSVIAIIPKLITYIESSFLEASEMLNSLFTLRDILVKNYENLPANVREIIFKNLEDVIIKIGSYFTHIRVELNSPLDSRAYLETVKLGDGIAVLNNQFRIIKTSQALLVQFGYTKEELIGKSFLTLFTESGKSLVVHGLQQILRNQRLMYNVESEAVAKDGRKFRVMVKITPSNNGDPQASFQAIIKDVTHIHETRNILQLMSMALESVGEGIVIMEPEPPGRILYVNEALERITGFKRSNLLGKKFDTLSGQELTQELEKEIFERSRTNGWQGELQFVRKNGKVYPALLHIQSVEDEDGYPIALVGIVQDISIPKAHQQQILNLKNFIEQIINHLPHYLFVTDKDFVVKFWNRSLEQDLMIPAYEAIGQNLFQLLPELRQIIYPDFLSEIKSSAKLFSRKYFTRIHTPEKRYYRVTVTSLNMDNGASLYLWTIQDIHAEEVLKDQITWQNAQLKFLENLSSIVNSSLNLKEIFPRFVEELHQVFPFQFLSALFPFDIHPEYYRIFYTWQDQQNACPEARFIQLSAIPQLNLVVEQHQILSLNVDHIKQHLGDDSFIRELADLKIQHLLFLPITFSNELLTILILGHCEKNFFREDDYQFLQQAANHLALAIQNSIQFEKIELQNQKLQCINRVFSYVSEELSTAEIIHLSLKEIAQFFEFSDVALYQARENNSFQLVGIFQRDKKNQNFEELIQFRPDKSSIPSIYVKHISDNPPSFDCPLFKQEEIQVVFNLYTQSSQTGGFLLLAGKDHYPNTVSYTHHLKIMQEMLNELCLALEHIHLFRQTIKSEQEWEVTFNTVDIGLAVVDEHFHVQKANRAFWQMLNIPQNQKDRVPFNILSHFSDLPQVSDYKNMPDLIEENRFKEWKEETTGRILQRRFFPLYDENQNFLGGIFTLEDVTDKRQKEEHILYLSRFPEANPNIVINLTNSGDIVYLNPTARGLLQKLAIDSPEKLLPSGLRQLLEQNAIQPSNLYEYTHPIENHIFRYVAYMPEDGSSVYLYGTEITEQILMQKKLLQTERIRAMGEMAAGVAHDFNNLLATILGRTQLLKLKYAHPSALRELEIIERAAKDGGEIVKRLQEATRHKQEKDFELIYLHEIIGDSILYSTQKLKLSQLKNQKIRLKTEVDENIVIKGNPIELKEVFTNLIFNAYDAMPNGGEISITAKVKPNKFAAISIRDTGMGIPQEILPRIFDPFFTTKGERGTGLGLSIVYNIVNAHHGKISVDSTPEQGTEFLIELPISDEKPSTRQKSPGRVDKQALDLNLLVVDDESEVLDTMAEILRLKFRTVDTANSGQEALQKISRSKFDIVLSDLGMPEMSGWELGRLIRENSPETKIILVTGWGEQAQAELKHHPYIDRIIAKPYDVEQLLNVIHSLYPEKATEAAQASQ